jgi:hypothetical protein
MDNLLGVMMRLRNARNLDSRQTNAIDNAYFACRCVGVAVAVCAVWCSFQP